MAHVGYVLVLTVAATAISMFALRLFWRRRDAKRWGNIAREQKLQRLRDHGS
jgi:hypothetical protein